jgi:hypothetical protein
MTDEACMERVNPLSRFALWEDIGNRTLVSIHHSQDIDLQLDAIL